MFGKKCRICHTLRKARKLSCHQSLFSQERDGTRQKNGIGILTKTAIRDWSNDVQLSTIAAIYQQLEADQLRY